MSIRFAARFVTVNIHNEYIPEGLGAAGHHRGRCVTGDTYILAIQLDIGHLQITHGSDVIE